MDSHSHAPSRATLALASCAAQLGLQRPVLPSRIRATSSRSEAAAACALFKVVLLLLGIGEAVVSGEVTADEFLVEREGARPRIIKRVLGSKLTEFRAKTVTVSKGDALTLLSESGGRGVCGCACVCVGV